MIFDVLGGNDIVGCVGLWFNFVVKVIDMWIYGVFKIIKVVVLY